MPAMLDDPATPPMYRVSGAPPYPVPGSPLPSDISATHIKLKDGPATLIPFTSAAQVTPRLLSTLAAMLNSEIDAGDTYPMMATMDDEAFGAYWFANFAAVLVKGSYDLTAGVDAVYEQLKARERLDEDWQQTCLGTYYIKPNYPGRSSHVCNAGFLVAAAARGQGVGRRLGLTYLEWAPRLGYTYSIFNLVYETNVASLKIWDGLGFERVGRVRGAASLKSHPGRFVDAIIIGRDLKVLERPDPSDDEQTKRLKWWDRFIYYLRTQAYPSDADGRERQSYHNNKARHIWEPLRDDPQGRVGRVMTLTGKEKAEKLEVVIHKAKQIEIVQRVHLAMGHLPRPQLLARIMSTYYWRNRTETVAAVIKACDGCEAPMRTRGHFPRPPRNRSNANVRDAPSEGLAASQADPHPTTTSNSAGPKLRTATTMPHAPLVTYPKTAQATIPLIPPDAGRSYTVLKPRPSRFPQINAFSEQYRKAAAAAKRAARYQRHCERVNNEAKAIASNSTGSKPGTGVAGGIKVSLDAVSWMPSTQSGTGLGTQETSMPTPVSMAESSETEGLTFNGIGSGGEQSNIIDLTNIMDEDESDDQSDVDGDDSDDDDDGDDDEPLDMPLDTGPGTSADVANIPDTEAMPSSYDDYDPFSMLNDADNTDLGPSVDIAKTPDDTFMPSFEDDDDLFAMPLDADLGTSADVSNDPGTEAMASNNIDDPIANLVDMYSGASDSVATIAGTKTTPSHDDHNPLVVPLDPDPGTAANVVNVPDTEGIPADDGWIPDLTDDLADVSELDDQLRLLATGNGDASLTAMKEALDQFTAQVMADVLRDAEPIASTLGGNDSVLLPWDGMDKSKDDVNHVEPSSLPPTRETANESIAADGEQDSGEQHPQIEMGSGQHDMALEDKDDEDRECIANLLARLEED